MPREIGMLMLGVAIGTLIPKLPAPIDLLQPYFWLVFFVVGLILLIKE
ncbi:MAG: hypothetical protein J4215_02020 [Candidatus Diapherotrites archaeon]|uniref:Uncharacterized protein n=1 Tax=Candidatus Iainarchaeum sp. TaxID=3101447 RepID=A0A8T4LEL3_9ARCH|nr:hypothetical protein [Candidatus Diapherotrites archaeon]